MSGALPLIPPLVAVMVAVPAATPVASPLPDTVATAALLEAHVTACPVITFPDASLSVTPNAYVPPTTTLADAGVTVTEATDGPGGGAPILPLATVRLSTHIV